MISPRLHAAAAELASRTMPGEGFQTPHIVLDTHIVMECFFWKDEKAMPLKVTIEAGKIRLAASRDAFLELAGVLSRPQFGLSEEEVEAILRHTAQFSDFASPERLERAAEGISVRCRDPEDQKFLTLAGASKARAIVTRDKLLFKAAKKIKTLRHRTGRSGKPPEDSSGPLPGALKPDVLPVSHRSTYQIMLTTALRIQKPHAMSATQIRKRMMRGAIKRRKSLKKSVF